MTAPEARLDHNRPSNHPHLVRPDLAYILPMAVFLAFIWIGAQGTETAAGNIWYPCAYIGRTVVVASMLVLFRRSYARIRWNHW